MASEINRKKRKSLAVRSFALLGACLMMLIGAVVNQNPDVILLRALIGAVVCGLLARIGFVILDRP